MESRRDFFKHFKRQKDEEYVDRSNYADSYNQRKLSRRDFVNNTSVGLAGLLLGVITYTKQDKIKQTIRNRKEDVEYVGISKKIDSIRRNYEMVDQEIDISAWANAIENAVDQYPEELQIQLINLTLTILTYETGFRTRPRFINSLPGLLEEDLRAIKNDSTTGPMEIHVGFLARELDITIDDARQLLNQQDDLTANLNEGVRILFQLLSLYNNYELGEEAIVRMVFADYSAGPFSSWRAGVQRALVKLGYLSSEETIDGRLGPTSQEALHNLYHDRNFAIRYPAYELDVKTFVSEIVQADQNSSSWRILNEEIKVQPTRPGTPVRGLYGKLRKTFGLSTSSLEYSDQAFEIYNQIKHY